MKTALISLFFLFSSPPVLSTCSLPSPFYFIALHQCLKHADYGCMAPPQQLSFYQDITPVNLIALLPILPYHRTNSSQIALVDIYILFKTAVVPLDSVCVSSCYKYFRTVLLTSNDSKVNTYCRFHTRELRCRRASGSHF